MEQIEAHVHNGVDSPEVMAKNVKNAVASADVVHLTGDETIAGIKTFSSIPVLPGSDPTTDNQAVRKYYVDNLIPGYETIASDTIRDTAYAVCQFYNTSYVKKKEIEYNEVGGKIRVNFGLISWNDAGPVYGKVYINGVAVGTERTVSTYAGASFQEDFTVETGDLIQLYGYMDAGSDMIEIGGFSLNYDKVFAVTPGTINLN